MYLENIKQYTFGKYMYIYIYPVDNNSDDIHI